MKPGRRTLENDAAEPLSAAEAWAHPRAGGPQARPVGNVAGRIEWARASRLGNPELVLGFIIRTRNSAYFNLCLVTSAWPI